MNEFVRFERAQVIHLLTDTDKADRQTKLLGDGEDDATLGGTVQLGQGDAGHTHRFLELLGLADGILAGAGIQHQHHFMRGIRIEFLHDTHHLLQLLHQVILVLQASGRIGDQHIDPL